MKRQITRADIMDMADYAKVRAEKRRAMVAAKRDRRVAVGPDATAYFESYETMWLQIHEMLHIEKGGEAQIADELRAYNPLVPNGRELVATVMFEIDDPERRHALLSRLGGVEQTISLEFGGETILARPETEVERTTVDGKTSSIHFLHFPLTPDQIARFRTPETRVLLGIGHPAYGHLAILPEATRAALALDLD